MKLRHKDKIRLARIHRSRQEIIDNVPLFLTWWWDNRRKTIADNQKKKYEKRTKESKVD